jgi:hypothetical protein
LPRTGNLGGMFFGKLRLILGCSADYDDDNDVNKDETSFFTTLRNTGKVQKF